MFSDSARGQTPGLPCSGAGTRPAMTLLALCALLAAPAWRASADEVVFYRCTAADGSLTVQNAPCPAGSEQRIQRVAAPARRAAAPTAAPAAAAAAPTATAAAPAATASPGATATQAPTSFPAPAQGTLERASLPRLEASSSDPDNGSGILDSDTLRREQAASQVEAQAQAAAKAPLPAIYQCQSSDDGSYLHELEPAPPRCVLMSVTGLGGVTPVNAASCEVVRDNCVAVAEAQRCTSWQQRFRDARGRERFAAAENQAAAAAERSRLQAVLAQSDCAVPD